MKMNTYRGSETTPVLTYDLIEVVEAQVLSVDLGIVHRSQVPSILHHNITTELHQQLQTGQMAVEGSNVEWSNFTGCQRRADVRISYIVREEGETGVMCKVGGLGESHDECLLRARVYNGVGSLPN